MARCEIRCLNYGAVSKGHRDKWTKLSVRQARGGGAIRAQVDEMLAREFVCTRCGEKGAHVERLSMSGTGLSRLFEVQPYLYAFVSCNNCGYTEVYNLRMLEGKDDLGAFLDILFAD